MNLTDIDTANRKEYKKVAPPFSYFGSKNKIALELCKELPPHNCWVEAFCGSAALTLAKSPSKIEVINDINSEIINVFEQLRNNTEELIKMIELTPYAEDELINARDTNTDHLSNVERARLFLVKSMMAINGIFGEAKGGFSYSDSYSRNGYEARVNRWNNLPERLTNVVKRLKGVRIENKDGRKVLKRYANRPATLVYLDPPYLGKRTNGYDHEANDLNFHKELLEISLKAKCMIFISAYENDYYDSVLTEQAGWSKRIISTTTRGAKGGNHNRDEVVWMNKHFVDAQINNTVPIKLNLKEKQQNKINPERK